MANMFDHIKPGNSPLIGQKKNYDSSEPFRPEMILPPKDLTPIVLRNTSEPSINLPPVPESNPVVGENLFELNLFPIRKNDNLLVKGLKGLGNFGASVVDAPFEAARKFALQGGSVLSGNGLRNDLPKNTSFSNDILPKGASNALSNFEQKNPILGGLTRMGLDTVADPTTFLGAGVVKNTAKKVFSPELEKKLLDPTLIKPQQSKPLLEALQPPIRQETPVLDRSVVEPPAIAQNVTQASKPINPLEKLPPWQMTKEEWRKVGDNGLGKTYRPGAIHKTETTINQGVDLKHKGIIESAIARGENIPQEVLKDYPDLVQKQPLKVMAADIENNAVGNLAIQPSYSLSKVVGGNSTFGEPTIPGGVKEHGFARNVRTDEFMNAGIRQDFTGDPATYVQVANKDTLAKAEARFSKGYEKALDDWSSSLGTFREDDVPLARLIANEASKRGDMETARRVIDDVSDKLTQAGRFAQSAKILRQSNDPISFIRSVQKNFKGINEEGRKIYGKKWNDLSLTDEEMNALTNEWGNLDEAGRDALTTKIENRIKAELPSSNMEKFDTWRRIAMLLNPKTHARNMIGNTIMMGARKLSDTIAAGLEKAAKVPQAERTKSVGWSKDKSLVNTVQTEWETAKPDLTHVTRWDLEQNMSLGNMDKRIFKNNSLNAVDKFSKDTLNMEDNIFLERAYKDALGQFMDARNLRRATPEARDYAKRRAFEATFKETNKIYEAIVKLKKGDGVISKAVDIAMPFTKTPTNIMYRAIDYSPLGFLKSLYTYKKGKGPALVIEDLAKGMTGSGVAALGFMLASMGWARGEAKTNKNAESITNMSGDQPNSITTPLGSYTFDWAQPISVPLAMGVAVYESLQKQKPDVLSMIYDSTASGIDTIFNMTMMKSVQDLLGGAYGGVAEGLMALPSNYVSQAMPTLAGQFARTVDDTKRSTYDPDPKKQFLNTFTAKTPLASKNLLPKLDVFGNEQKQGNAFQQFLSPGYALKKSNDPATNELSRLYKSTKDTDILPKVAPTKTSENNIEIKFTAQQVNEFQKIMGNKNFNDITSLIKSASYGNQDDKGKADQLSKLVRKNYNDTKTEIIKKYDLLPKK